MIDLVTVLLPSALRYEIKVFRSMGDGKEVAYLAKQFAAKEAVVKALGTGFSQGIALPQIEITRRSTGAPAVNLEGRALTRATELGFPLGRFLIR